MIYVFLGQGHDTLFFEERIRFQALIMARKFSSSHRNRESDHVVDDFI